MVGEKRVAKHISKWAEQRRTRCVAGSYLITPGTHRHQHHHHATDSKQRHSKCRTIWKPNWYNDFPLVSLLPPRNANCVSNFIVRECTHCTAVNEMHRMHFIILPTVNDLFGFILIRRRRDVSKSFGEYLTEPRRCNIK